MAEFFPFSESYIPNSNFSCQSSSQGLIVGYDKQKEQAPIILPNNTRFRHMHILGRAGTGKTTYLEFLIRQDMIQKRGCLVIDCHGSLYKNLLDFAIATNLPDVIPFDLSLKDYLIGWNPISFHGYGVKQIYVDTIFEALYSCFYDSGNSITVNRWLKNIISALIELNLPFPLAVDLADPYHHEIRLWVYSELQKKNNHHLKNEFDYLVNHPQKLEFELLAVHRRLTQFFNLDTLSDMFSQHSSIDFFRLMNEGKTVLVNLSTSTGNLSDSAVKLLGTLFIFFINSVARKRETIPEHKRTPFFFYIDEFYRFAENDNIRNILEELRKYHVGLIVAHQNLNQLDHANKNVSDAVKDSAQCKVLFGQTPRQDCNWFIENISPFVNENHLKNLKQNQKSYSESHDYKYRNDILNNNLYHQEEGNNAIFIPSGEKKGFYFGNFPESSRQYHITKELKDKYYNKIAQKYDYFIPRTKMKDYRKERDIIIKQVHSMNVSKQQLSSGLTIKKNNKQNPSQWYNFP